VTLVCDPRLAGLFESSFPDIQVIGTDAAGTLSASQFDVALSIGSPARPI
jgi:hypothetical protein